jgi:hypothetical protein
MAKGNSSKPEIRAVFRRVSLVGRQAKHKHVESEPVCSESNLWRGAASRSYDGTSASNGPGGGTEAVNLLKGGLLPKLGGFFGGLGSRESTAADPNRSDPHHS